MLNAACSAPGGPYPSLQPRVAEQIDPRVPVERPLNDRPASAALLARIDRLIGQARSGDATFGPAIAEARQRANQAGTSGGEGWIAAQQTLSAAIDARRATALALSDLDALTAELLATQGGIAPSELRAIQHASATIGAIDSRQSAAVSEVQAALSD